jgi:hypothetical protein
MIETVGRVVSPVVLEALLEIVTATVLDEAELPAPS